MNFVLKGQYQENLFKNEFKQNMTSDIDLVRKKLVVVGNGNVGKTSLLYAFKDNRFCQDYVPTLFEGNTHIIDVDNKRIELLLIDTAGQEEYARYILSFSSEFIFNLI
jgi:small GTP-binding protein